MMHRRLELGEAGFGRRFNLIRRIVTVCATCWVSAITALHFRIYGLGKLRDKCLCS